MTGPWNRFNGLILCHVSASEVEVQDVGIQESTVELPLKANATLRTQVGKCQDEKVGYTATVER